MLIIVIIFVLFFVLIAIMAVKSNYSDDGYITTIETVTEEPHYNIRGGLKRQLENGQFFVIDPADKSKTWVNSNDDMYEDADGKIWRLN